MPPVTVKVVGPDVPEKLLQCKEYPAAPGQEATQRDVAAFIVVANVAYQNCNSNLHAVKDILTNFDKEKTATEE